MACPLNLIHIFNAFVQLTMAKSLGPPDHLKWRWRGRRRKRNRRETLFETRCFLLPGSWRKFSLAICNPMKQKKQSRNTMSESTREGPFRKNTAYVCKTVDSSKSQTIHLTDSWLVTFVRNMINRLHTDVTFEESKTQTSTPTEPTRGHFPRSAYIHQWHITVLRLGSKQNHCPFLASPAFRMQKPPKLVAFRSTYGGFLK